MTSIEKINERRIPVIVCPNCGEKDQLGLDSVDREINLDTEDIWIRGPYGPPNHMVHSRTELVQISGYCRACRTTFQFKVTWCTPIRELK